MLNIVGAAILFATKPSAVVHGDKGTAYHEFGKFVGHIARVAVVAQLVLVSGKYAKDG